MRIKQLSTRAVVLGVLSAAFIWPALWNHGPFVFPDTRTYLRAAEAPANTLMHKKALQPEAEEVSGTMADSQPLVTPFQATGNKGASTGGGVTGIAKRWELSWAGRPIMGFCYTWVH